jgi:dolichol-phosphate mannosyltransferase
MTDNRDTKGDHLAELGQVLVVIPTYNERDNLEPVVKRLNTALPQVHVLVVDDGSPDGTGELADKLVAEDDRVKVIHRTEKAGLGAAYVAGFEWALANGYDVICEMDCDGSHAPEDLPRLLDALTKGGGGADLVIGSRYVPGGKVVNWPVKRQLISRGGNLYCKILLGVGVKDITAGFRAYRAEVLRDIALGEVASQGYCFQIDLAWRTLLAGFRVLEVPITFTERAIGVSKMHGSIVREAVLRVAQWGLAHRLDQLRSLVARPRQPVG